jgi:hypothetical protein
MLRGDVTDHRAPRLYVKAPRQASPPRTTEKPERLDTPKPRTPRPAPVTHPLPIRPRKGQTAIVSARVSTLLNKRLGGGRYLFLLVEWNDYAYEVRDELNRQAEAFGLDLGPDRTFVQAYEQRMYDIAKEVVDKAWPDEIKARFDRDQDPIILIIDRDWHEFDPSSDPYAVIWVSDFHQDPAAVRPMFQQLAYRTRKGDDVIAYLHEVAEREQRRAKMDKARYGAAVLARIASYVEIKPSIFGVAVDLKAVLRDIAESRS